MSDITDKEISAAINLTTKGRSVIFYGLWLGVECSARDGGTTRELVAKLNKRNAVYIWGGQQPAYFKESDILNTFAGHYMAACCADETYVYFADPGYQQGKTRIKQEYLDLLWHDIELATWKIVYGFMIEVPFQVDRVNTK